MAEERCGPGEQQDPTADGKKIGGGQFQAHMPNLCGDGAAGHGFKKLARQPDADD